MIQPLTTVAQDAKNNWTAQSTLMINSEYQLVISTSKTWARELITHAQVNHWSTNDFIHNPKSFLNSIRKTSRAEMLTDYTLEDLEDMMTFKLNGYDIGYALKKDDNGDYSEIVSVFNNSGIKGIGDDLIQSAVSNGGRYLDHYDGFLSNFYSKHGFEEYKRDKFDPQYDPTGEFRDKYGEADIIYRRYNS